MLLKNLIKNTPRYLRYLKIKGLTLDSREVKKGYIFFALKGNKSNGEHYIVEAINKGAGLIICSKNCKFKSNKIPFIKTTKVKDYLTEITSNFYKQKPKNIIAVTGTNGKTSVADFFYQILNCNNVPVASIGTLGIRYKRKTVSTNLTSPDIITIHKWLHSLKKNKIDNVIIEASSHGLSQSRLNGINFKAAIFTNLSQDHLDYHKTMNSYLKAKLILFSKLLPKRSYIISDESIKEYSILNRISNKRKMKLLNISKTLVNFKNFPSKIYGSFQIKNLSMAILAAQICGLSKKKIEKILKNIQDVNGRLNFIKKYSNNIRVFIDYAHTPEALREAILSIKNLGSSNISLVFGCGGERDFKKRPLMAKIAKYYCNKIYVTDDNPRNENPGKIRKEITTHLKGSDYYNIGNRADAIKKAIANAEPNETILIAGKGHENYQDYGKQILRISDKEIIKKIKNLKKNINQKNRNYSFNSKLLNQILTKKKFYKFKGLVIDSRDVKKGDLFLAIKGKKNDGHKFISQAFKKGASYVLSSSNKDNKKNIDKIIKIQNPIIFLNKFAKLKRNNCNAKIVSITGSAGKTSLKNMLYELLKKYDSTYASPRSFNNHYGVPVSLSNLNSDHRYGIFEVGMSKAGEINRLSKLIKPDLAIITNIAEAHIENFKNIAGIAKAKAEIIYNIKKNGTIILNRDDSFFDYLKKIAISKKLKVLTFGKHVNSDICLSKIKTRKFTKILHIRILDEIFEIKVNNINIYNVLASLAVLKELNMNLQRVINSFEYIKPSQGRGRIHLIKRYKKVFNLIDESYNANPLSVKSAINNFSAIKKNNFKKYLVLGDMLELGKRSNTYHIQLSKLINSSDIDKVFIKGEKSYLTYKNLKKKKEEIFFRVILILI